MRQKGGGRRVTGVGVCGEGEPGDNKRVRIER